MRYSHIIKSTLVAVALVGCSSLEAKTDDHGHHKVHAEYTPYDASSDARADVNAALVASKADGKMTIVAMGANWCHDSRGFSAQWDKARFKSLLDDHYRLLYVDVGKKDRNIDIAQDFGVDNIVGTPTVFIVSASGEVLNLDTAPTWRNADSRSEDEIYDYFNAYTKNRATFSGSVVIE